MTPGWESTANIEQQVQDLKVHQAELETEIQELRSSRTLLEESRARYASLYDFAPIAFCTVDTSGRVLEANLTAAAFLGTDRNQLIGKPLSTLMPPEDRPALHGHFEQCISTKGRVTTEVWLTLKSLGRAPFQMVSTAVIDEGDRVIGCKTALTDISALKRSEERLGLLADASALLSSSFDIDDTVARVVRRLTPQFADLCFADVLEENGQVNRIEVAVSNPAGEAAALALRKSPIPWRALADAKLETDTAPALLRSVVADVAEAESAVSELAVQSLMMIPVVARGRVLGMLTMGTSSGRRYGTADLAFGRDLATRAAMAIDSARVYQRAQRAVQARQEVLSIVSHDLKNPLAGIALSADALLQGSAVSERRRGRRHIERIRRGASQMRRIIDDLLDLGSIDAGQLAIECNDESLDALIDEALEVLTPLAQDKGVELAWRPRAPALWVLCDRNRTLQVLSNLIGNAIKYTPPSGWVEIDAERQDDVVRVKVKDNGPGMTRAELRHLFERYWRAKRSTAQGRGLGLFISKRLVEAQGGIIAVDAEVGRGTTACFTLPPGKAPQLPRGRSRAAVLVVEDDKLLRDLLCELLHDNAYEVSSASNGREALDAMRAGPPPSVLLLDLKLPVMDGRELMEAMRDDPRLKRVPVVLVSGVASAEELARLGANAFLMKPLDYTNLLTLIGANVELRA
jgi:PAS domain S-box-containing protein